MKAHDGTLGNERTDKMAKGEICGTPNDRMRQGSLLQRRQGKILKSVDMAIETPIKKFMSGQLQKKQDMISWTQAECKTSTLHDA